MIVKIPLFGSVRRFPRKFRLVKGYPLEFLANFGLRNVFLRAENVCATARLFRKRTQKMDFLNFLLQKSYFRVSGVFLRYFWH